MAIIQEQVQRKLYKGFSTVNNPFGNWRQTDLQALKQDLNNHFGIRKGEKLMNPDFGSNIKLMVMEQLDESTKQAIITDVNEVINNDPRLKASSVDLTVSLTGIDPDNIAIILSSDIKGSTIEIWRGFFNSDNQIITSPTQQFFKRYQGIINNVAIQEEFNDKVRQRIATCVISCASFKTVLENRIAGIRTNSVQWKNIYSNDTSMDRVQAIQAQYFDFGKEPMRNTQSTETGASSDTTQQNYDSGGA